MENDASLQHAGKRERANMKGRERVVGGIEATEENARRSKGQGIFNEFSVASVRSGNIVMSDGLGKNDNGWGLSL